MATTWTPGTAANLATFWTEAEARDQQLGTTWAAQTRAYWEGLHAGQLESERAAAWRSNDRERYWLAATYRQLAPALPA